MDTRIDIYDAYATQYAEMVAEWERAGITSSPIIPQLLTIIGDVSGLAVLDAGCGEGYLARILADRGAKVTAIDLSARLIEMAREKDPENTIEYLVADLSDPLPDYQQRFDLIASNLVLNDVYDYQGFITTLGTVVKPGGRLVVTMNNPYSYVVRKHVTNYFDSGAAFPYRGMSAEGIKVHFYQRTLEDYIDAFLAAGFQLAKLADLATIVNNPRMDTLLPEGYQFPYFMILSFVKAREASPFGVK